MYYNRILGCWVIDAVDYFLFSFIIGRIVGNVIKEYTSERRARKRLANSIIHKSRQKSYLTSEQRRIEHVYRFALLNPAGQQVDGGFTLWVDEDYYKLAQAIQKMVERMYAYLKKQELYGHGRFFFRAGRLCLELLLSKCNINVSYFLYNTVVSTLPNQTSFQVITISVVSGTAGGFIASWCQAGALLISPSFLVLLLFGRSIGQQLKNVRDYEAFSKYMKRFFKENNEKFGDRFTGEFIPDFPENTTPRLVMEPQKNLKSGTIVSDFNTPLPNESFDDFIKRQLQEQFGLIENPTEDEIQKFINRKPKPKGKTVNYSEFIKQFSAGDPDELGSSILDAEILDKQPIPSERIRD